MLLRQATHSGAENFFCLHGCVTAALLPFLLSLFAIVVAAALLLLLLLWQFSINKSLRPMFSSWSIEHNATYYQRYHVPSDKAFVRPTDFIYLFEIFSQQLSFFIPRYLKLHENEKKMHRKLQWPCLYGKSFVRVIIIYKNFGSMLSKTYKIVITPCDLNAKSGVTFCQGFQIGYSREFCCLNLLKI